MDSFFISVEVLFIVCPYLKAIKVLGYGTWVRVLKGLSIVVSNILSGSGSAHQVSKLNLINPVPLTASYTDGEKAGFCLPLNHAHDKI